MGAYAKSEFIDMVSGTRLEWRCARRARAIGELDDIDGLVRNYRAKILRFIAFSIGDPDLAETITQDTLLKAWMGRENFRGDCSVRTWLTRIALNVTRDHLRSRKFKFWKQTRVTVLDTEEMAAVLPAEGSNPERQVLAKEKVRELSQAVADLSPNQRTVFLMRFVEEMPVNEISQTLGMPVATVRTHLHRALNAVRGRMGAKP